MAKTRAGAEVDVKAFFGKPVEAFHEAGRAMGSGKSFYESLRSKLGAFTGKELVLRVKGYAYNAASDVKKKFSRTVRITPQYSRDIQARYYSIIRAQLDRFRESSESDDGDGGFYEGVGVYGTTMEVGLAPSPPPKKKAKKTPKKKTPTKKTPTKKKPTKKKPTKKRPTKRTRKPAQRSKPRGKAKAKAKARTKRRR